MSILKIPYYSDLDLTLEELWNYEDDDAPDNWVDFIKELDKNIIDVETITNTDGCNYTCINFGKEEHISWFLLRWS